MRVKIIEPGWEKFNDQLGGTPFTDGVSDDHLSRPDIDRIAATLRIETFDGDYVPINERIIERHNPAPQEASVTEKSAEQIAVDAAISEAREIGAPTHIWTKETLGQVADEKGIVGLRDIADPMGVKNVKITGLIDGILAHQAQHIAEYEQATGETFVAPDERSVEDLMKDADADADADAGPTIDDVKADLDDEYVPGEADVTA